MNEEIDIEHEDDGKIIRVTYLMKLWRYAMVVKKYSTLKNLRCPVSALIVAKEKWQTRKDKHESIKAY